MQTNYDAVIVGAGPAGSAAAILLARAGWRIALVEKHTFPRSKVCGECLAASNLPLLEELGIAEAVERSGGAELRSVALMGKRRESEGKLPPASPAQQAWGRAIRRETLDTLLLEQARSCGADILQPCTVAGFRRGQIGQWYFDVLGANSEPLCTLFAPVAILANGSWETFRSKRSRARRPRRPSDLFAFKAHFRRAAVREGLIAVLTLNGGYGGMVLADGGLTTVACCIRRDRLESLRRVTPGLPAGEAIEAWMKGECLGLKTALSGAERVGPWLAVGPLHPGAHQSRIGGPFRIGNAAGEAHPIIGEGMSMALQSAWLLCTELIGAKQPRSGYGEAWQSEIQQRVSSQWRRHFGARLRIAAIFAHLAMRPAPAALMLALVRIWPALFMHAARWSGKTSHRLDLGRNRVDASRTHAPEPGTLQPHHP